MTAEQRIESVTASASAYLAGKTSLEEFSAEYWRAWHRDASPPHRLSLVLAEWRRGHRTDEEVRAAVADYMRQVAR